ncbi:MAG: Tad domain-containing protein [Alphaproteobacteria bacterium]|nr:Tad domain-containing protein [Alphaproteobacteria bacterium]
MSNSSRSVPEPSTVGRQAFADRREGSVTILFGLMGLIMLLVIGASVDMARWLHARTETVSAVDSAVLAGARNLQVNGLDAAVAVALAQSYYEANVLDRPALSKDTITFKVEDDGTSITAEGTALLDTTFLKLAGINTLPLLKLAGSEYSKAVLSVNGNAEFSLEVSLMLDITGSMCNSGSSSCTSGEKITAMKDAAKDLINVVVWDSQGSYSSRVALVPFSAAVNFGTLDPSIVHPGPAGKKLDNALGSSVWWTRASACAAERFGPNAYSDAAPTDTDRLTAVYTSNGLCQPDSQNAVVPLTSDKSLLNSKIDGLQAAGATGGHLGTAWAWYMLSPEWGNILPVASSPQPYSLLSQVSSSGRPLLQKIAVLMTDGEYNMQYCDTGVRDKNANGNYFSKGNCESANGSSASQARAMCASMKAKGITIYSVGFQLAAGGGSEATLTQCATSQDHVFLANNAAELKQSFRNIAMKISDLRLSK